MASIISNNQPTIGPDAFQKNLLACLLEYRLSVNQCGDEGQCDGTILCSIPPGFAARNIKLHAPLDTLPADMREHIASMYFSFLNNKWKLSYHYDRCDTVWVFPHLPFSPQTFEFPFYTRAAFSNTDNTIRVDMNRSTIAIHLDRANLTILLNRLSGLESLLSVKTYREFAAAMFALAPGTGCIFNYRTMSYVGTEIALLVYLLCLGDEVEVMRDIAEILSYVTFVFIPFFARQSLKLFEDLSSAEFGSGYSTP